MIVKTVFIVKKEQLPIEENVNIVRWIVKIYKVNHHNIEKKTNKTTDLKLTISAIRWRKWGCMFKYRVKFTDDNTAEVTASRDTIILLETLIRYGIVKKITVKS